MDIIYFYNKNKEEMLNIAVDDYLLQDFDELNRLTSKLKFPKTNVRISNSKKSENNSSASFVDLIIPEVDMVIRKVEKECTLDILNYKEVTYEILKYSDEYEDELEDEIRVVDFESTSVDTEKIIEILTLHTVQSFCKNRTDIILDKIFFSLNIETFGEIQTINETFTQRSHAWSLIINESIKLMNEKKISEALIILNNIKNILETYTQDLLRTENKEKLLNIKMFCLYNIMCCKSLENLKTEAIDDLKTLIALGWKSFRKIITDTDLLNIIHENEVVDIIKELISTNTMLMIQGIESNKNELYDNGFLPYWMPPCTRLDKLKTSKIEKVKKMSDMSEINFGYYLRHGIQIHDVENFVCLF